MSFFKNQARVVGLVLAGGQSRRMGRDKAALSYGDAALPAWRRTAELLASCCGEVLISVRPGQELSGMDDASSYVRVDDRVQDAGPMAGFLSAWELRPGAALLAVACDLPMLDKDTLEGLLAKRDAQALATAYRSAYDGLPEPLCALYEPEAEQAFREALASNLRCPRKVLIREEARVRLLTLGRADALENANTPADYERLKQSLTSLNHPMKTVTILYFGLLKQRRALDREICETSAATVGALYAEAAHRYGLGMTPDGVKFARNENFCGPDEALGEGDVIAFLPPMAGG